MVVVRSGEGWVSALLDIGAGALYVGMEWEKSSLAQKCGPCVRNQALAAELLTLVALDNPDLATFGRLGLVKG